MKLSRVTACLAALAFTAGCQSRIPEPPSAAPQRQVTVIDSSASPITAAAEREVLRRQEAMRRADEAALRAAHRMSAGDYEGAMSDSRSALGEL